MSMREKQRADCTVYSNDGSFSASKITNLSIEMADLEPKVLAVRELQEKLASIDELNEVHAIAVLYGRQDGDDLMRKSEYGSRR
jgi:hypothetical protein